MLPAIFWRIFAALRLSAPQSRRSSTPGGGGGALQPSHATALLAPTVPLPSPRAVSVDATVGLPDPSAGTPPAPPPVQRPLQGEVTAEVRWRVVVE